MLEFFPAGSGRELYIFYNCFNIDADLFLFYSTIVCLLLIKIGYGIKVVSKGFKEFTHTYSVLTTLVNLLVLFLDIALAAYDFYMSDDSRWQGFVYSFVIGIFLIYFIGIAKAHNKNIVDQRKAAQAAVIKDDEAAKQEQLNEKLVYSDEEPNMNEEDEWSDEDDEDSIGQNGVSRRS